MALKFLRNGVKSDNIVAMPNMTGTSSWDFFELPMSNRVEPFNPDISECERIQHETMRKKMTEATDRPYVTAVGHICKWEHDKATGE